MHKRKRASPRMRNT